MRTKPSGLPDSAPDARASSRTARDRRRSAGACRGAAGDVPRSAAGDLVRQVMLLLEENAPSVLARAAWTTTCTRSAGRPRRRAPHRGRGSGAARVPLDQDGRHDLAPQRELLASTSPATCRSRTSASAARDRRRGRHQRPLVHDGPGVHGPAALPAVALGVRPRRHAARVPAPHLPAHPPRHGLPCPAQRGGHHRDDAQQGRRPRRTCRVLHGRLRGARTSTAR